MFFKSRIWAGLALTALMIGTAICGEVVKDSGTTFAVDAVKPYIDSGECPGAISVFYKNGRQETACLGYADVARKVPMSLDRTFMQCSQIVIVTIIMGICCSGIFCHGLSRWCAADQKAQTKA